MEKATVVMDTNFLLVPHQFGINVFVQLRHLLDSYTIIISTATIKELEQISKGRGKAGVAARVAKKIIDSDRGLIEIKETAMRADDFIEACAKAGAVVICTNDIALKNRVKRLGVKVISLRTKSKIGFV